MNFSLRSNYKTLSETGPDWQPKNISPQDTQIVAITPPNTYDALTHNVPATSDGYFKVYNAYNNIFSTSEGGYQFMNRSCQGELKKKIKENFDDYHCTWEDGSVSCACYSPRACPYHNCNCGTSTNVIS